MNINMNMELTKAWHHHFDSTSSSSLNFYSLWRWSDYHYGEISHRHDVPGRSTYLTRPFKAHVANL